MKIILATNNKTKREQITAMLDPKRFEVLTLADVGITGEAVEDGDTLVENARKKALFAFEKLPVKVWVVSEDTGLFIRAVGWEPGVHTAYWAGKGKTELETMNYCLERMKGKSDRYAEFRTVLFLLSPEGKETHFQGVAPGRILEAPRCAPQPKMPYSSIFVPLADPLGRSWAEMPISDENLISHRGKAVRQAIEFLALASYR